MNRRISSLFVFALVALSSPQAKALTLDWSGYFRASHDFVHNYQVNKGAPVAVGATNTGEYFPSEGDNNATYSTFFMKLKPRVLVNDNIIVRTEWNVGDPIYGFFGRNTPQDDRSLAFGTGKDGMSLSVARLWLDVHTDFGTLQVGRAPMHWGLGVVFNSADGPFDRYQSTSDTIRLVSKFGYLSLMPLFAKNSMGRSLSGARNPVTNAIVEGNDDITDYGVGLRYENPEEDIEGGLLYYKRNAGDSQSAYYYPSTSTTYTAGANGINLRLFDFYIRKSWHRFDLGIEAPIFTGEIGDVNGVGSRNTYKATALAVETALKYDTWRHTLKFGTAPGQSAATTGARGRTFSAVQFHRSYKLGMILFNYNLGNFGANNPDAVPGAASATNPNSSSPYDAMITNARYVMLSTQKSWEQWGLNFGVVWAQANETAQAGKDAYNHRTRQWFTSNTTQSKNMGLEFDLGTRYNWDDNISFGADFGLFLPGDYYKYINSATAQGPAKTISAISFTGATVF